MSLHRARIKTVEEIDPKEFCCSASKNAGYRNENTIVLINTEKRIISTGYCQNCDHKYENVNLYIVDHVLNSTVSYDLFVISMLDIDEHPLTPEEVEAFLSGETD